MADEELTIVVEGMLVPPSDFLWQALTDPDLIAQWFMPAEFEAEPGEKITFKAGPVGDWDGVFHGEVIEAQPTWRLKYSMRGGSPNNEGFGRTIDTVLTWTLSPLPNGTHVRLEHSGFTEDSKPVYQIFNGENGWAAIINRYSKVVVKLHEDS